ncbi:erythromycin esterase family protein [Teredinibacter sp. KSP-S5-2]|uniref:erythromycin esterase family protein n=1 Tax=Teredinibacter sp. KSP-S5-2 TaxID=3034506 RepID=UPI00293482D1|nr:erythromycin esterase family protein [Teredinibacter sp. KSP-S5-2]WNO08574.1 erythromycin esterase family protein [Teredinibacter sp. KSP-S5-2]
MNKFIPTLILLLSLFGLASCQTQISKDVFSGWSTSEVKTLKTVNDDFTDLRAFGDAIGDKRIVMLDELTHGEGNIFALKSRLIEYLHKEKGFDVFAIESGIFDVHNIWQNEKTPIAQQAPGNIFYMYANSKEVIPLFNYIDSTRSSDRPLELAGFDGRLSGELSKNMLTAKFAEYLKSKSLSDEQRSTWEGFSTMASDLLNGKLNDATPEVQDRFFQGVSQLRDVLADDRVPSSDPYNSDSYWRQITDSLAKMAEVYWGIKEFHEHDLVMADNIDWMLTKAYPNKKIILWGHYIHLNKYGNYAESLTNPDKPASEYTRVDNLTSALAKKWKDEIYVAHFTGSHGSYIEFRDMNTGHFSTRDKALLENIIKPENSDTAVFVDTSTTDLNAPELNKIKVWSHEYKTKMPLRDAPDYWDGVFIFPQITPVDYNY